MDVRLVDLLPDVLSGTSVRIVFVRLGGTEGEDFDGWKTIEGVEGVLELIARALKDLSVRPGCLPSAILRREAVSKSNRLASAC